MAPSGGLQSQKFRVPSRLSGLAATRRVRVMKSLRVALPLVALLAVAIFSSSAGAVGWVTGRSLSRPDREAVDPQAGITPSGERIVAWRQVLPAASKSTTEGIAVRIAPPG